MIMLLVLNFLLQNCSNRIRPSFVNAYSAHNINFSKSKFSSEWTVDGSQEKPPDEQSLLSAYLMNSFVVSFPLKKKGRFYRSVWHFLEHLQTRNLLLKKIGNPVETGIKENGRDAT